MLPFVWVSAVIFVARFVHGEPVVQTSVGTITGKLVAFQGTNVESFLGIPYAKPPVGNLRFALPQPFGSVGNLNATKFSARCPQAKIVPQTPFPESEDCLHLNVYRKSGTQSSDKKHVVAVIHGGAYAIGSASDPLYNALPFTAVSDVVITSFNYRLGVLGFADMKQLAPGNLGLYDIQLALEWIRSNIAAFGGDPDKVTLAGVSAGSMVIGALIASPLNRDRNLFKNVIMDAGVLSKTSVVTQDVSLQRVKQIAAKVGCETDGESMLRCLRTANASDLVDVSYDPEFSVVFTFAPTIDGKFILFDASNELNENVDQFADVRMMIGVAKNEGTILANMVQGVHGVKTDDDFIRMCTNISKSFLYPLDLKNETVQNVVIDTYLGSSKDHFNDVAEFLADGTFNCPMNAFVNSYAKRHKYVYVYYFDRRLKAKHMHIDPNLMGAFHSSPFGHMFGAYAVSSSEQLATDVHADDNLFIIDTMNAIAEFVKSDNSPKFRGVTWPNYAAGEGVLHINDEPTLAAGFDHEQRCLRVFPFLRRS